MKLEIRLSEWNGSILDAPSTGITKEWPYSLHKILIGFRLISGIPPFTLCSTSFLGHALFRSMVKDGLKRENYQSKYATSFWWQNTKTLIGFRESQLCRLNKIGREFSLQSKSISQETVVSRSFTAITFD
jgi:hypothetical protein